MMFYLTILSLVKSLMEDTPSKKDGEEDKDFLISLKSWNQLDYLSRHYVMNYFNQTLCHELP